ncbi:MAG: hypothetical protein WC312_03235 [Candidatus Omnitrophota bacterium]|jgi:uncharacterized protein YpmB
MLKKIIFNLVLVLVLIMIAAAIIRANKPKHNVPETSFNAIEEKTGLIPREAEYYRVIE